MSLGIESMSPADIAAVTCNNGNNGNNGMWGDNSFFWIVVLFLFAGWGRNGFGGGYGNNGGNGGVMDGYVLASDFSNIERKIDGVNNGLCDGFYAVNTSFGNLNNTLATNFAAAQNTMTQGFAGLNTAMVQQGYENRIATNDVANQLAQCCCDEKAAIADVKYAMATNTNAIQTQLAQCCCDTSRQIERGFCDTNYNLATQNNATMQAIDKVGDRIIDYLANDKAQALRDENQALRLAASQQAQNNYLVNQLAPKCPIPAFLTCNPYTGQTYTNGYSCGCNNGCGSF